MELSILQQLVLGVIIILAAAAIQKYAAVALDLKKKNSKNL